MPDPYKNPEAKPCLGTYTWIPTVPPDFGGVNFTRGFSNLIIDRGSFRNYWYKSQSEKNVNVVTFGSNTNTGFKYNPIINATRPLALGFPVAQGNGNNIAITNVNSQNLIQFDFSSNPDARLSCIQIQYDLSIWKNDPSYDFTLNPVPPVVLVYGVTQSGSEELISTDSFKGLKTTRIRSSDTESGLETTAGNASPDSGPYFVNLKIKVVEEILDRSKFPKYKAVIFKVNDGIKLPSSLSFVIKKIMFFTADRVNFRYISGTDQLPCKALGYSMAIDGTFIPALSLFGTLYGGGASFSAGLTAGSMGICVWPPVLPDNCDIDVKLFNPDYTTNSPGFAHSLNLHLLIFIIPAFGPVAGFLLPGVLQPMFGVILGPRTFTQQWIFYGNSNNKGTQLAVMNSALFKENSGTVKLQQGTSIIGQTKQILPLSSGYESVRKIQPYFEQIGSSSSEFFKNIYLDSFNIPSQSESYSGSVPRLNSFDAIEAVANFPRTSLKKFAYSTYLFDKEPSLYELFTKSDPCLLFRCTSSSGFSSSTFIEPGFLYASLNCFSTDSSGMFDTKLVFRFFFVDKGLVSPDPKSSLNKTLKIENSGTNDSSLTSETFSPSWDFSNVLVTGNILGTLNYIETSEIINQSLKNFVPFDGKDYDLYCGVYAMSNLNDSFAGYDLTKYSTIDVPTITFSINNDFIIQLPVYYRKSYGSGGTLQAQRDFGLKGKYTIDNNSYVIINKTYGGETQSGVYNKTVDLSSGVYGLLTFASGNELTDTKFSIQVSEYISKTDYVLLVESTSNARIGIGEWNLTFDIEPDTTQVNNLEVKFEVDLVSRKTSKLILKILSSEFTKAFTANGDQPPSNISSAKISVPFYLPQEEGLLIVRIYFRSSVPTVVNVNKITLDKNTLEQFNFIPQQTRNYLIGFYEDLPIQPSSYISGCQNFILLFDETTVATLFNPLEGLKISGVIYSPTWVVDLPENMELKYNASQINKSRTGSIVNGVEPYKIFFRTGLSNDVKVVDTKRHSSGLIETVANTETNTSKNAVQQIVSEGFLRFTTLNSLVTTPLANSNLIELDLKNPILSKSDNQNIQLALSGQNLKDADISTVLLNIQSPNYYATQPSDGGTLMPNEGGYVVSKNAYCAITTFDFKDDKSHNLGVTANGNLIYSFNQSSSTSQASNFTLAEGDPENTNTNPELNNFNPLYISGGEASTYKYYGPVQVTFPGILLTSNQCVIFYVYATTNKLSSKAQVNQQSAGIKQGSAIYGRYFNGSRSSDIFLVFDFGDYCSKNSDVVFNSGEFPSIRQLTVCKDEVYTYGGNFYLAFDCGNKIFVLRSFFAQNNCFTSGLGIVYGNLENAKDTAESKFNKSLNQMVNNSSMYKFTYKDTNGAYKAYDKDLEFSQRVGFADFDGIYMGIQFYIGNKLYEIVIDKSYVLTGVYRLIGEIT